MEERRSSPRIRCRIRCIIRKGKEHSSGCILDLSEGGLCLLSPTPIEHDESLSLSIEVPRLGRVNVKVLAWHTRRVRGAKSGKRAWSVGAVLVKADPGYFSLLQDAIQSNASEDNQDVSVGGVSASELIVYKVRVQKKTGPRTRLLSLTATSEDDARELATADLDDTWRIVDVTAA